MGKFAALFFLIMFMIGTDTFLISPLLPTLQSMYDVSTERSGWMIGAYTLGSAVFALIAGPLSDGWNRKKVMLGGLFAFSISTILCGFAGSFWTMCLFRFLAGVSAAFTAPQVWASIPAVMPASRISKTMGLAFSGLAASQALGVPIGSWLAALHWAVPFWTIGAVSLILLLAVFVTLPDIKPAFRPGERASILNRYVPLITSGRARSAFLAYLLLHLGSGTAFAFLGKWLADHFALPVEQIGVVMMFLGLGTLLGSLLAAQATRRMGQANSVIIGITMIAAWYILIPILPSLTFIAAGLLVIYTTLGVIFPIVMEVLTSLNASIRGTISSLANSTMNGANTFGAWIGGLLYVQFNGFASLGVFAAICLAFSLCTFHIGGVLKQQATHSSR